MLMNRCLRERKSFALPKRQDGTGVCRMDHGSVRYCFIRSRNELPGYKTCKFKLNGQLLHAAELSFNHPRTGERVTFNAPLPDYFGAVLEKLDKTDL